MKRFVSLSFFSLLGLLLAGCGIGGFWMEGVAGKARDEYLKSIKPYGAHWIKEGMTKESRLDDTVECGSARTERIGFSADKIEAEIREEYPAELRAYIRLREAWSDCMRAKGYVFLEKCDERCQYP